MDKIKIKNLQVFAKHGVFPEENRLGQNFWYLQYYIQIQGKQEKRMI